MSRTLALGFLLLAMIPPHSFSQAQKQSVECPPEAALLSATDPAYADAMALGDRLRNHGFVVRCMFPSKLGSIFEVEDGGVMRSTVEGESVYRTNFGDIDVVFMPKPQNFAEFKVSEHRAKNGYVYTFAGVPRVWRVNKFESAYRMYFLKYDNQLFIVGDPLRARLEQALDSDHP